MRRVVRPYAWWLGVVWGLPLLVTVVALVVLPKDRPPPGSCSEFGCGLSEADGFAFVAWIAAGAVFIPAGLLGVLVIAVVQVVRHQQR